MAQRGSDPAVDWPARPDTSLALNRMGTFDWDLDSGRMHLDPTALEVLDLRPGEFDGTLAGLRARLGPAEEARLDARVAQALKSGQSHYGAYVRTLARTRPRPGCTSRATSCGTRTDARTASSGSSGTPPTTRAIPEPTGTRRTTAAA